MHINATIGVSPYEALYGYHPRFIEYTEPLKEPTVQGVAERISKIAELRASIKRAWKHATANQAKHYNKNRLNQEFKVGDWVGLSTRNFNFKKGERKLAPTFIPVKVLKRIGDIAYEVDLPKKYKKMHNVVGVNLLEPWHGEPKIKGKLPEISEDLEVWEVEQITDHRKDGEQTWYRIKWKGWPVEYNTWEPEANVKDSPDLLKEYKDRKKHAKWEDYPVRS
ncbi:uncharacterized protein BROUX77_005510 [Berkeleyomyces rouxiae]|uniref:uncharacterized protein n=1 Tax=Berkeleyomyces rouxiae TaxID=2035830 RepID=UPI003B806A7E